MTDSGEESTDLEVGKLYPVARAVLTPIFRSLWRVKVDGLENVPASGGAIFCPNHTSVIDSFFLPLVLLLALSGETPSSSPDAIQIDGTRVASLNAKQRRLKNARTRMKLRKARPVRLAPIGSDY